MASPANEPDCQLQSLASRMSRQTRCPDWKVLASLTELEVPEGLAVRGMVEDVEGLPACLNPITLFEREVLEDRDVPVFEALVVESVDNRLSE